MDSGVPPDAFGDEFDSGTSQFGNVSGGRDEQPPRVVVYVDEEPEEGEIVDQIARERNDRAQQANVLHDDSEYLICLTALTCIRLILCFSVQKCWSFWLRAY